MWQNLSQTAVVETVRFPNCLPQHVGSQHAWVCGLVSVP